MIEILYIFAFVIYSAVAVKYYRKHGLLFFPVFFYLYIMLFHVVIPFLLYSMPEKLFSIMPRQASLQFLTDDFFYISIVLTLFASIGFGAGWSLGGAVRLPFIKKRKFINWTEREGSRAIGITWIILILGVLAFFIFFHAYGGPIRALVFAREFRDGTISIENPYSFLRPIGDFTKVAMLMFVVIYISGLRTGTLISGLVISTTLAFTMIIFQSGRLTLAIYIVILLVLLSRNKKISLIQASLFAGIASLVLFYGYQILYFFQNFSSETNMLPISEESGLSFLEFFVIQLSFPSVGLAAALSYVDSGIVKLSYGIDYVYGVLSIIPSRFVTFEYDRIDAVHTSLINPHGTGVIPTDVIVYGIYAFGIFGPLLSAFIIGFFPRLVFRYINSIPWPNIAYALNIYFLFSMARRFVYYDPVHSINSLYYLIICISIIYVYSRSSSYGKY